ncbi:MAG: hypothetical protein FKY71_07235 [Spiribacter salinus]|uniref:Twin-arginine translocation pathway signal protein n=1 Tax=Spiribacter salinus TaxID=1335746 RepID=A0A540VSE9_9GAMM|nr:MAG: hypothetical protein FKY71_07235 [Spiribacter salinus]
MKRRRFLQGLGTVSVVVAGGTVWRATDQGVFAVGTGPAYEPWTTWRDTDNEGPLALVRAGILAANPHNTQPWMFRVSEEGVELYADRSRHLGSFDPYLREMHLGLGCAVENMMLAARAAGYEPALELVGGQLEPIAGQPGRALVARISLDQGEVDRDALFEAIPQRHTNRGPYDLGRGLSAALAEELQAVGRSEEAVDVVLFTEPDSLAQCRGLITDATEAIIADRPMVHESERWFRHSWDAIQKYRDGPTLDAAGLSPLMTGIAKLMPRPSAEANHQYWLDATRDVHVATAPGFGLIFVDDLYDRAQALQAGQVWQRLHLWAATQGLAMQPLNQPVERVDRERQLGLEPSSARALAALTGERADRPTFAFRVGYPSRQASASPRRAVEQVVL